MERRDYILREIEKFGMIIRTIRQRIFGGKDPLAITVEDQIKDAKGMLLEEINFDKLITLNDEDLDKYVCSFEGLDIENTELLAECIFQLGKNDKSDCSKKYLEKVLQLYELCNLKSKTYSLEREMKIEAIKKVLFNF